LWKASKAAELNIEIISVAKYTDPLETADYEGALVQIAKK